MANFARSLKSPYLSPRLRPSMPGRTVSSSSDMSTNSPLSEDFADVASSGRNTPTLPTRRVPGRDGFWDSEDAGFPGAHIRAKPRQQSLDSKGGDNLVGTLVE
ncbi:hypothetical protein BGZ61DRAFT_76978 [Ilyonectria robusta]|uniref:uncharacterized protein n=1 Tax=Ilyonectria robusta TaxID=1079257 RepID=UPI001E8E49F5|nr:uncharacterized protein BGZ61DRAFT_76978 [Ilyonectria robusta]KAH8677248.1 hypothetical protein BGZ61DRAFT_76978 [Ilyonectria robusta]